MSSALACPHCGEEMRRVELDGDCGVDICAECHGHWFDPGEIDTYLHRYPRPPGRLASLAGLRSLEPASERCPRCLEPALDRTTVRAVPAFGCRSCRGLFIAAEALDRVPAGPSSAQSVRPLLRDFSETNLIDAVAHLLGSIWKFLRRL